MYKLDNIGEILAGRDFSQGCLLGFVLGFTPQPIRASNISGDKISSYYESWVMINLLDLPKFSHLVQQAVAQHL